MLPKVILIHGNGGSTANDNWFPSVKSQLTARGLEVIARTFPDNNLAREKIWIPFLKDTLGADANTILIGHSSGALAAMRFAENTKLFGSVLVGACYTDLGDENEKKSGYYDRPWNWQAIVRNQRWIVQYHSTDDPYIPISEARYVHEKLGSEYYEMTNEGHFGSDSHEKLEFPHLVTTILTKLNLA